MARDLYDLVADLLTREEFEARVRGRQEEWGGLLEADSAALLVVDELGRSQVNFSSVADIVDGLPARLKVEVFEVGEFREFERRPGKFGRVVNLRVGDPSGTCRLVLWDDDVEMVTTGRICRGIQLRLIDCEVRRGPYGLEVARDRWGVILPLEES